MHDYWRRKRRGSEDETQFSSDDLKMLLGDMLKMYQAELAPDALQHISLFHQRLTTLATTMDPSLINETLIGYLRAAFY